MAMKEFKCPLCGGLEHYRVPFVSGREIDYMGHTKEINGGDPISILKFGFGVSGDASGNFFLKEDCADTYVCAECGHVDLFAKKIVNVLSVKKQQLEEAIIDAESRIAELEERKMNLEETLASYSSKIDSLSKLVKSEDITIRQQKEYLAELDRVRELENSVQHQLRDIPDEQEKTKRKLKETQEALKSFIV